MNITEKDLKKLWGRAAGLCSAPGCQQECIPLLDPQNPTVIGEMAHVIARSKDGARGDGENTGEDTYENLVLLCPTCHTKVDKAPAGVYPQEKLLAWKEEHEAHVRSFLQAERYNTMQDLAVAIARMLQENYVIWKSVGPESDLAKKNPYSTGAFIWELQKLAKVIPNNTRIARLLENHRHLIPLDDWSACAEFILHASAFEQNAYCRLDSDSVPRLPPQFGEFIKYHSHQKQ